MLHGTSRLPGDKAQIEQIIALMSRNKLSEAKEIIDALWLRVGNPSRAPILFGVYCEYLYRNFSAPHKELFELTDRYITQSEHHLRSHALLQKAYYFFKDNQSKESHELFCEFFKEYPVRMLSKQQVKILEELEKGNPIDLPFRKLGSTNLEFFLSEVSMGATLNSNFPVGEPEEGEVIETEEPAAQPVEPLRSLLDRVVAGEITTPKVPLPAPSESSLQTTIEKPPVDLIKANDTSENEPPFKKHKSDDEPEDEAPLQKQKLNQFANTIVIDDDSDLEINVPTLQSPAVVIRSPAPYVQSHIIKPKKLSDPKYLVKLRETFKAKDSKAYNEALACNTNYRDAIKKRSLINPKERCEFMLIRAFTYCKSKGESEKASKELACKIALGEVACYKEAIDLDKLLANIGHSDSSEDKALMQKLYALSKDENYFSQPEDKIRGSGAIDRSAAGNKPNIGVPSEHESPGAVEVQPSGSVAVVPAEDLVPVPATDTDVAMPGETVVDPAVIAVAVGEVVPGGRSATPSSLIASEPFVKPSGPLEESKVEVMQLSERSPLTWASLSMLGGPKMSAVLNEMALQLKNWYAEKIGNENLKPGRDRDFIELNNQLVEYAKKLNPALDDSAKMSSDNRDAQEYLARVVRFLSEDLPLWHQPLRDLIEQKLKKINNRMLTLAKLLEWGNAYLEKSSADALAPAPPPPVPAPAAIVPPPESLSMQEEVELNQAALNSQRSIRTVQIDDAQQACSVAHAYPDGNCGFTATRLSLALQGKSESLPGPFTRESFIALIEEQWNSKEAVDPLIAEIFTADGLDDWKIKFKSAGYYMFDAHFNFVSRHFNIAFQYYAQQDGVFNLEPTYERIYQGDGEPTATVFLAHVSTHRVDLSGNGGQLNHFDALIINPTPQQIEQIDRLNGGEAETGVFSGRLEKLREGVSVDDAPISPLPGKPPGLTRIDTSFLPVSSPLCDSTGTSVAVEHADAASAPGFLSPAFTGRTSIGGSSFTSRSDDLNRLLSKLMATEGIAKLEKDPEKSKQLWEKCLKLNKKIKSLQKQATSSEGEADLGENMPASEKQPPLDTPKEKKVIEIGKPSLTPSSIPFASIALQDQSPIKLGVVGSMDGEHSTPVSPEKDVLASQQDEHDGSLVPLWLESAVSADSPDKAGDILRVAKIEESFAITYNGIKESFELVEQFFADVGRQMSSLRDKIDKIPRDRDLDRKIMQNKFAPTEVVRLTKYGDLLYGYVIALSKLCELYEVAVKNFSQSNRLAVTEFDRYLKEDAQKAFSVCTLYDSNNFRVASRDAKLRLVKEQLRHILPPKFALPISGSVLASVSGASEKTRVGGNSYG